MALDPKEYFAQQNMPAATTLLGWTLLDYDTKIGWMKVGFTAKPEFANPRNDVQGGFVAAMLDDTMAPAIVIMTGGKFAVPTIDLHTRFHRPTPIGAITCEGKVTKLGRQIAFTEGSLFDQNGKLCATATASAMLVAL